MWNILASEWRRVWKAALGALLFLVVFAAVFFLYGLPMEPVIYGLVLCLILGILLFDLDLFFYSRKYMKLQRMRSSLETIVEEMPRPSDEVEEIYQELLHRLYEANRELEKKWSTGYADLQDYYTIWAHQIKTPIAAMRLLLQTEETPVNRQLELELFKVEQYVELALGYLRTENISGDLQVQEFDLDEIIHQAVKKYAKMFILEKVSLDYRPVNCRVITDRKWLEFVLEQILSNALKYTHQGKISIYMDTKREKTLVIEDTGIGISSQDLPRVFERGFTGYNGRKDKHSTGIGLYSVKKIMDKLSHVIFINSEVGKGTKVYLDLNRDPLEMF
ncbi:MAG: sensor histidine kinase [Blautia sp.]|jgi:signal transduction histidine kinase